MKDTIPDEAKTHIGITLIDQDPRTTSTLGVYRYATRLVAAIDALPPPPDLAVTVWVASSAAAFFPRPDACRWIRIRYVTGRFATGFRRLLADHWVVRRLARQVDVLHFPKGWLPLRPPRTTRLVATLHDTIPDFYVNHYPDYVGRRMRYFQFLIGHTLAEADRIITISKASRQALVGIRAPRHLPVVIASGGLEAAELPRHKRSAVLVLGSNHPHKRTVETLDLLNRYAAARGTLLSVVITGYDDRRHADLAPLKHLVCNCVGYLDEDALKTTVRASACLVYLSEVEGFGLPLLEAYEQGTPVCYRNTSAPAEVMQGAPGGWDGQSFESFCTAMDAVRAMPPDAIAEVRASLAERFNWPAIAQATLAVYRELAEPSPDARVRVLATALDAVGYGGVIHRLRTWRAARGPTGASSVVAANVHVVTECALRKPYRADVADADLVVPDGMPLVWAIRWFGTRLRTRCYGPELMVRTLAAFQSDGARHFLYGSTPETLAKLQQSIARRWPSAIVAGALSPSFGELDDAEEQRNIAIINAARPDFVWLAMGCPKQENWMHRYRRDLQAAAVLGVGAAFDFIAGTVPQAPPWLQRLGLEWAFRLAVEPRRLWRRYLIRNPYFLCQILLQRLRLRWRTNG